MEQVQLLFIYVMLLISLGFLPEVEEPIIFKVAAILLLQYEVEVLVMVEVVLASLKESEVEVLEVVEKVYIEVFVEEEDLAQKLVVVIKFYAISDQSYP